MQLDARRAARLSPVDVTTPAFARDALQGYRDIQAKCPVAWHPSGRYWGVSRYRDAARLLRDPNLGNLGFIETWLRLRDRHATDFPTAIHIFSHMPFNFEGERHAFLRRTVARAVAPVADETALFRAAADRLLARVRVDGGFDLAEDFASRIFFDIVCDLAAIPAASRPALRPISRMSWLVEPTISIARRRGAEAVLKETHGILVAETERQVASRSASLIGRFHRALPADEHRVDATAALIAVVLMMGNDAIGGTIAAGVRALLEPANGRLAPPAQAHWAAASDDVLRYTAPVDFLIRRASDAVSVDDMTVRKGEVIMISPLAANHDAAAFGADADVVSAGRDKGVGLSFGAGAHLCVGMRMARNIVREAFAGLAALPPLKTAGAYRPEAGIVIRTAASLPVAIE